MWSAVLAVIVFGLVARPFIPRTINPPSAGNGSSSPAAPSSYTPARAGRTLRTKDATDVPIASSEADLDRLMELAAAHDNVGINQMLLDGRAWGVASGTKCLIINGGFLRSEVRISDGPHSGQSGWVSNDFFRE